MARRPFDTTGNETHDSIFAKIQEMLIELYATIAGAISATSITVTGAVTAASAAISGAITSATATISGLATFGSAKLDTGTKTAAATGGAATLNKSAGVITSEALTTAAAATYTLTLTNSTIAAADQVFASLANGTNTQGVPMIVSVTPAAGSVVIVVANHHATEALNGTLKVAFMVLKN